MKLKPALLCFYPAVTLFVMVDAAIIVAMVWNSLKLTDSAFLMGMTLCVATILPFALERMGEKRRKPRRSIGRLIAVRAAGMLGVMALAYGGLVASPAGFVAMAFLVGVTDYFTLSTLEANNTRLVLDGHIGSEAASRLMQTCIQIGAFGGSLLGGAIVDRFAAQAALLLIGAAGLASLLLCAFIPGAPRADEAARPARAAGAHQAIAPEVGRFIAALAMIGFHIGAFNALVPIVFQKLNAWDATQFGLVGGLAGLGAFLGALLPRIARTDFPYLGLIVAADAVIVFAPAPALVYPFALVLGFSMNQLRISLRRKLIELADGEAAADAIAARTTFAYLLALAAAPFVLTAMTTRVMFGLEAARMLMMLPAIGLTLAAALLTRRALPAPSLSHD